MLSALQSAISGLQAFGTRIQANANNVANIDSQGYKRTRVTHSSQPSGGVQTEVERIQTPGNMHYEQTTSGSELIEASNVDIGVELPDLYINATLYKANIKTVQTTDEMIGSLLNIKA